METKFTKGNWHKLSVIYEKKWINITSDKGIIARSFYGDKKPIVNQKEAEANALLISKAPEMFEMLEKWSILNTEHYKDLQGFILETKKLLKEATEL